MTMTQTTPPLTERDQFAMAALAKAIATYDARMAECPINSPDPATRAASLRICSVCHATRAEPCGRDNPWPVVEAARHVLPSLLAQEPFYMSAQDGALLKDSGRAESEFNLPADAMMAQRALGEGGE